MIFHPYQTPIGAIGNYHVLKRVTLNPPFTNLICEVNTYLNQQVYEETQALLYGGYYSVPVANLSSEDVTAHIENWLVTDPESPLRGGSILVDLSAGLDGMKARAWAAVKTARTMAENGVFEFEGGVYQANQGQIMGAVLLALVAKLNAQAYAETWTLKDNSTRELSADQVIALGVTLGQYMSSTYAAGRVTREAIQAANSADELKALGWTA